jgi:hypothetical protein
MNLMIVKVTFPSVGFENNFGFPPYDIAVQNYDKSDFVRVQNPFLYNVIALFILSVLAGLISIFTYAIYFLFLEKNRIYGLFVSFLCCTVADIALGMLGHWDLSLLNQLNPFHKGNGLPLIVWGMIFIVISIFLLIQKGIRNEFI